jgi:hypothetical protein
MSKHEELKKYLIPDLANIVFDYESPDFDKMHKKFNDELKIKLGIWEEDMVCPSNVVKFNEHLMKLTFTRR